SAVNSRSTFGRASSTATTAVGPVTDLRFSCALDRHATIRAECRRTNRRTQCLNKRTLRRSASELRDDAVENPAQGDQRDRAENSLSQNIPGDRFVLEFALVNFVPEKERVKANNENN